MSKLFSFLRYRKTLLLFYALTAALLLIAALLSQLPMAATLYCILLLTVLLLLLLAVDGVRYFRTLRILDALAKDVRTISDRLPAPDNAIEAACYSLLAALNADATTAWRRVETLQTEQIGYYTLWVHQIKTPIAAMRLLLQDADERTAMPLMRELGKIEQYADLALRYAKLSDIASDLIIAPCELFDVVHASVKKFAIPFIYQKLTVDVQPFSCVVTTDARWLGFILEQVLSNAVKYTARGGVTITLRGDALTVSDTGVGIRAEDLPRIFEKGYTGYNGRMDTRASGVGLYLAKRAADALHIRIDVASRLHEGTEVTLHLPVTEEMLE